MEPENRFRFTRHLLTVGLGCPFVTCDAKYYWHLRFRIITRALYREGAPRGGTDFERVAPSLPPCEAAVLPSTVRREEVM